MPRNLAKLNEIEPASYVKAHNKIATNFPLGVKKMYHHWRLWTVKENT